MGEQDIRSADFGPVKSPLAPASPKTRPQQLPPPRRSTRSKSMKIPADIAPRRGCTSLPPLLIDRGYPSTSTPPLPPSPPSSLFSSSHHECALSAPDRVVVIGGSSEVPWSVRGDSDPRCGRNSIRSDRKYLHPPHPPPSYRISSIYHISGSRSSQGVASTLPASGGGDDDDERVRGDGVSSWLPPTIQPSCPLPLMPNSRLLRPGPGTAMALL